MTFTLEQIKAAFWKNFHESGELWFSYLGSDEENQNATETHWQEFERALLETSQTERKEQVT